MHLRPLRTSAAILASRRRLLLLPLLFLAGCVAAPPPAPPAPPEPVRSAAALRADTALAAAVEFYHDAAYAQAEAALLSPPVWQGDVGTRVEALKYLAFTYCITDRPVQCRWSFVRALQLDPDFALLEAERGHPGWGPQFAAVQQWFEPGAD